MDDIVSWRIDATSLSFVLFVSESERERAEVLAVSAYSGGTTARARSVSCQSIHSITPIVPRKVTRSVARCRTELTRSLRSAPMSDVRRTTTSPELCVLWNACCSACKRSKARRRTSLMTCWPALAKRYLLPNVKNP
jgi:hypothetical protein